MNNKELIRTITEKRRMKSEEEYRVKKKEDWRLKIEGVLG